MMTQNTQTSSWNGERGLPTCAFTRAPPRKTEERERCPLGLQYNLGMTAPELWFYILTALYRKGSRNKNAKDSFALTVGTGDIQRYTGLRGGYLEWISQEMSTG